MKILVLANCNTSHTLKWVKSLLNENIEIRLFSIHSLKGSISDEYKGIKLFNLGISNKYEAEHKSSFEKLIYLKGVSKVRSIIKEFRPDFIHAHYATSYGLIAALSGYRPVFLSVWGTDINSFPRSSLINKYILRFILSRTDALFATSNYLATDLKKYTSKTINVIPFGVDTDIFRPIEDKPGNQEKLVLGITKSLEDIYGINNLIKAFKLVIEQLKDYKLYLNIVGTGSLIENYKRLVNDLGLNACVIFSGYVSPSRIPLIHNSFDIAVYPSLRESFGVAILESMACGKPIIASNVGGIPEIVEHNRNGFLVEPNNIEELSERIIQLVKNKNLMSEFGKESRKIVMDKYELKKCVSKMIMHYRNFKKIK